MNLSNPSLNESNFLAFYNVCSLKILGHIDIHFSFIFTIIYLFFLDLTSPICIYLNGFK